MGISKQQLSSILGKARDLCSPEGDRLIESYNNKLGTFNLNDPDPSQFDDYEQFDKMYLTEDNYQSNLNDIQYNKKAIENSKMPDKIKQSMLNEIIDVRPLENQSVLSGMKIPEGNKIRQNKSVNEQKYIQNDKTVDYSIIKAIVNECLNEYFSKQQLNENNSIKTIGLKSGTIKIVDNKGNVYAAKLEKIGNTNK